MNACKEAVGFPPRVNAAVALKAWSYFSNVSTGQMRQSLSGPCCYPAERNVISSHFLVALDAQQLKGRRRLSSRPQYF